MPASSERTRRDTDTGTEAKAGAVAYVYCKGCGAPLEDRTRLQKPKAVIDAMMCEPCRQEHGHALMPSPGAPTYCYRCGTLEEVVIEPATTPITHHVCPQCLPDRLTRFNEGDFTLIQKAATEA